MIKKPGCLVAFAIFILFISLFSLSIYIDTVNRNPDRKNYKKLLNNTTLYYNNLETLKGLAFKGKFTDFPEKEIRGWEAFCRIQLDTTYDLPNIPKIIKSFSNFIELNLTYHYLYYKEENRIYLGDRIEKQVGNYYYEIHNSKGELKFKVPLDPDTDFVSTEDVIEVKNGHSTIYHIPLKNGIEEGTTIYYYLCFGKKLYQSIHYENGEKTGVSKVYYYDGQLAKTGDYKKDQKMTNWKYFDLENK